MAGTATATDNTSDPTNTDPAAAAGADEHLLDADPSGGDGGDGGDPPGDPPATDDPAQQPNGDQRRPRMVSEDVMVGQLSPLRARNRELESALDEHRRQLNEQNELIRRLQGSGDQNADTRRSQQQQPQPQTPTDADVERRAAQLALRRDAARISENGIAAYGNQWGGTIALMDSLGLNGEDFVATVMDVAGTEKSHEVIHAIASDPERAARMAQMSPARRIAEIARISEPMSSGTTSNNTNSANASGNANANGRTAAPNRVSRAPAPAPRTDTGTRQAKDWRSDAVTDAEFSKGWEEHMRNRRSRAR